MNPSARTAHLSRRARALIAEPPMSEYAHEHRRRMVHPVPHTDPYVALCVAENRLLANSIATRLDAVGSMPAEALGYQPFLGMPRFREELARFLERRITGRRVSPEHIAAIAGAGSVLEILFHAICDPGDAVLVPTPSYAGFWADLETRDAVVIEAVPRLADDGFRLTPAMLDEALDHSRHPVRALLFTSPDNPLGHVYEPRDVEEIVAWADRREIHLVLDEVYALSIHGDASFVSGVSAAAGLGPRRHLVWAFSKDFAASGLRSGVLVSENPDVLETFEHLAYWSATSSQTQHALTEVLADEAWIEGFVTDLRHGLRRAYSRTVDALERHGIGWIPADAGIFLLADLRPFLDSPTWESEERLWRSIVEAVNVNMTPGSACRSPEPGFMRICFAAEPTDLVVEGIERIGRFLESR